jgi:pimeloyl-ACP methyl ester carboxylesterase
MIQRKNKSKNGISFYKAGKGEPVILIHGIGLRLESWVDQIKLLKKNYTVFAIDLPGHGKSKPLSKKKVYLKNYCNEIIKFIKINKINKPILVGHSLGALIAIEIAGLSPNILKCVVAVSPIYKKSLKALNEIKIRAKEIREKPTEKVMVDSLIKRWFANSKSKKIIKYSNFIKKLLRLNMKYNFKGYTAAYDVFSKLKGNSFRTIKKIKIPMLYLTGEKDLNSTPLMSKNLAKINNNKYKIIKGARHILQLTHSKQFNFYLIKFIKGLE